jgi:hypothetical protein
MLRIYPPLKFRLIVPKPANRIEFLPENDSSASDDKKEKVPHTAFNSAAEYG